MGFFIQFQASRRFHCWRLLAHTCMHMNVQRSDAGLRQALCLGTLSISPPMPTRLAVRPGMRIAHSIPCHVPNCNNPQLAGIWEPVPGFHYFKVSAACNHIHAVFHP